MFRDVSIDSQLYYWFISGDQTSTVEWEVVLKEEVDEVARIIFDEISGIIPDVKFIDRGIKIYDRLDIEKLEHIH
jgi:hypothetical protein